MIPKLNWGNGSQERIISMNKIEVKTALSEGERLVNDEARRIQDKIKVDGELNNSIITSSWLGYNNKLNKYFNDELKSLNKFNSKLNTIKEDESFKLS